MQCDFGDDGFATNKDKCFFTCDDGFELKGPYTRKCIVLGEKIKWNKRKVVCKKGNLLWLQILYAVESQLSEHL